jgi:hypothetical protein
MSDESPCDHQYVSTTQKKSVSASGIFGWLFILIGVLVLLFNPVVGALLLIVGIIIAATGGKETVFMCAKCGARSPHQP